MISISTAYAADSLSVGIILWRGQTEADQAFAQKLKTKYPKIVIHEVNANQNIRKSLQIIEEEWKHLLSDMDYLFTFGSRNSIQIRKNLSNTGFKGLHIGLGNSSILSNAHKARKDTGEKFLLGQTSLPDDALFTTYGEILKIKKIGIPYNLREPQNIDLFKSLSAVATQRGIEVVPIRTKPDANTLKSQIERALKINKDIDVLYYPLDSFLLSNAKLLNQCSANLGILAIGSNKKYMSEGTPLGLDSNYPLLGKKLAQQVIDIENGALLTDQAIVRNQTGRVIINPKILRKQAPHLLRKLPKNAIHVN